MRKAAFTLILAVLGPFSVAASISSGSIPNPYFSTDIGQGNWGCGGQYQCNGPFADTSGKTSRSLTINHGIRNLVLISAGQSLREGQTPSAYIPTNSTVIDNFNFLDGNMYAYSDPPLGASYQLAGIPGGGPGSLGGRIADKFVSGGQFDRVIVVNVAVGGTAVAQWATGGILSDRLCLAMRRLAGSGITQGSNVTFAIEWGQGESDAGTSQASYTASLNSVISNVQACGFSGRFFVALETMASGVVNSPVRAAQAAVVNGTTIFQSGDIDTISSANRLADQTHLNDSSAATAATLIYNQMHASGAPF